MTIIPSEIASRPGLEKGDTISWIEDGIGRFRVGRFAADTAAAIEQHEAVSERFASVFRALAK